MKHHSRIIVTLLALLLLFSIAIPSFAIDVNYTQDVTTMEDAPIQIVEGSDTNWYSAAATHLQNEKATLILYADDQLEGIYRTTDNMCFQEIAENTFVPVKKKEFVLADEDLIQLLTPYKLPAEVVDGILCASNFAKETENTNAKVAFFVPDESLISVNSASSYGEPNTIPVITTTWQGHTFNNYIMYFTDLNTKWVTIASGPSVTEATLKTIKEIVMNSVGQKVGEPLSIFQTGLDCLSTWLKAFPNTSIIYGSADNAVQANITFDLYFKYTFYCDEIRDAEYYGCHSQQVRITKIETDTFLYTSKGGEREEEVVYPNKRYKSAHYDSPEETAYLQYPLGYFDTLIGEVSISKTQKVRINFSSWLPRYDWPSGWPEL